jgi:hypothetical protein
MSSEGRSNSRKPDFALYFKEHVSYRGACLEDQGELLTCLGCTTGAGTAFLTRLGIFLTIGIVAELPVRVRSRYDIRVCSWGEERPSE